MRKQNKNIKTCFRYIQTDRQTDKQTERQQIHENHVTQKHYKLKKIKHTLV